MMWYSGTVEEDDVVRVNYYLRELYGDPESFPDAWAAPFGVLALKGPSSIFVHPLVRKVRRGTVLRRRAGREGTDT
jgi:hypothetical protein